jgi:hypothetical protein
VPRHDESVNTVNPIISRRIPGLFGRMKSIETQRRDAPRFSARAHVEDKSTATARYVMCFRNPQPFRIFPTLGKLEAPPRTRAAIWMWPRETLRASDAHLPPRQLTSM